MANETKQLAEYCANLNLDAVPKDVVTRAKFLILDLVGIMVRARHDAESTPAMFQAAKALGFEGGAASVFGDAKKYSPAAAAMLNGALGHSLDFDDTHAEGSLHPGCPVIAAAFSAAEMVGASGKEVLAGVIAGYEVTCRLSMALVPGDHYDRGYHPTATCGAFGAAAAAGRIFRMSAEQIENAFGIVLSQAAGSMQFLVNGAWTKRFQVGWAATNGLVAASLAREGYIGAAEAVEGRHAFLHAYAPNARREKAVAELGSVYELMKTAVKPYPSCRYGHAAIDAARMLRAEKGLKADEILKVEIGLPEKGMLLIGAPYEKKASPENVVDGQFSANFVVASALATGQMTWDSYELISDQAVQGLCKKITSAVDAEVQAEFPRNMAGKVTVTTPRGTFTKFVSIPKGEPENFLTAEELKDKFAGLADSILGKQKAAQLADAILNMEQANDVSGLMRLGAR
ncbi:MAG: MmgE/PrpD family protein [Alphaproteobacteria bacterium]|nr:MmgE/PrpD family protein [Alphaproteobacteria bacterium]